MYDMDKNDQLSYMNKKEKKDLLHFLKNYYVEYKPHLDISGDLTFGMEIECIIPKDNTYEHKKYTPFNLVAEKSVSRCYGYEFQSPVLCNNDFCWMVVRNTCEHLKLFCKTNERCGGHIHFGANIFKNNSNYLRNLVYLWLAFEDIIYRFSNGEMLNTRFSANIYAKPAINSFKYLLIQDEMFSNVEKFFSVFKNTSRNLGINFNNYYAFYNHESLDKNTIEIRVPNGTLEEVIWQNNINFFSNLMLTALRDDLDLLDLYLKATETNCYDEDLLEQYGHIKIDKALELADLIYDKNEDKFDFLKQYIKNGRVTKSKALIKTKKFWK